MPDKCIRTAVMGYPFFLKEFHLWKITNCIHMTIALVGEGYKKREKRMNEQMLSLVLRLAG